ncbi:MAG: NAD(P)/FAD-dependent oxidoreductase, partial [Sulfurimicrobium sp.]|nr:NAD(P)/FAD-dependent oxidoreductase [Sulfurimicrobium sp.]
GLLKADQYCHVEGWNKVYVAGDSGSFPGPDWMPKQAHMAELQAAASAGNLLAELNGRAPSHTFRVELMCIMDTLDSGMFIWRTPGISVMLPPLSGMHWLKRLYEWWYLRRLSS